MNYTVHSSSIIDEGATIGNDTKVWHFSHVCSGAVIINAHFMIIKV
jgi:UDP-2-acetamido-3-amino-2,3-dideoxy-glucuronate N-acetyltransferase